MAVISYKKCGNPALAEHFTLGEFACKGQGCCETVLVDEGLVTVLEMIRSHFGKPVILSSGYRCDQHNKAVGGAAGSFHTKGMAADIVVQGVAPLEVARFAERMGVLGIGLYADFVHVDTRVEKSFWYGHGEESRQTFLDGYRLELPLLKKGDKGETVKALQTLLIMAGCECGSFGADGDFGEATDAAVRSFQKKAGLTVDGCVGEATMSSLLGVRGA